MSLVDDIHRHYDSLATQGDASSPGDYEVTGSYQPYE